MIVIDNIIVTEDIVTEKFVCDLSKCKGGCCEDGAAGAPLDKEELAIINDVFETVKPYLTKDAIAEIEARRAALSEKYTGIETELRAEFERKAIAIERYGEQTVASDRDEFERNRRESVTAIETRDSKRVSRVQGRLRNIFETRNKLLTLRKRKITYTRLRKFRELFETGTYKSWA